MFVAPLRGAQRLCRDPGAVFVLAFTLGVPLGIHTDSSLYAT